AISFLIGNTFLAYIIGSDELFTIITDPPSHHVIGLSFMLLFSLVFYGVFARFREQACVLVCPYGRLQSVLLDSDSIVVAYDHKRGEPRGDKSHSGAGSGYGDCIDCFACVNVCPTGIDIRNGTQLECVNCTACIDACDQIMDRHNRPRGLIRYASENNIARGVKFHVTPRMVFYSAALVALIGLMSTLVLFRTEVEASILRASGSLYEEVEGDLIRNLYTVKIINKTGDDKDLVLRLEFPQSGSLRVVGPQLRAAAHGLAQSVCVVEIPRSALFSASSTVIIGVYSGDELLEEVRTNFFAPEPGS
ncbi:MAG TPA: 4Fe-4S dicluster domain-containing protein, partial [candidate division Zixibacteria bacterium]|nr:4Fe-4S dicluster domain-containing protein [candidate division Zixibacteria bacterium]